MSKIIQPFNPTVTITIAIEEKTGKTRIKQSKPMALPVVIEALIGALRQVTMDGLQMIEKRYAEQVKIDAKTGKGLNNGS